MSATFITITGAGFENVVKTTILLEDMSSFPEVNARYAKYFPTNPPARATFAGMLEHVCVVQVIILNGFSWRCGGYF